MSEQATDRQWSTEEQRWIYPDEQELPQRLRDAADAINELNGLAGPWQSQPYPGAYTALQLNEYADSLQALLERVGLGGSHG